MASLVVARSPPGLGVDDEWACPLDLPGRRTSRQAGGRRQTPDGASSLEDLGFESLSAQQRFRVEDKSRARSDLLGDELGVIDEHDHEVRVRQRLETEVDQWERDA